MLLQDEAPPKFEMAELSNDDISYAMETTKVVLSPDRRIDTFGTTNFEFCLITELMDEANQVRVREGRVEAQRPQILAPEGMAALMFDGFGEHSEQVSEWFKTQGGDINFLKYGFNFFNRDMTESVVHDSIEAVSERVVKEVVSTGNPSRAVIHGVDDTWGISLLKFTWEMISASYETNEFDFKRRGML